MNLFFLYILIAVRDELNDYYQQLYNPETRPNTSAVHKVFFMAEMQRYIMSFLGHYRSSCTSDDDDSNYNDDDDDDDDEDEDGDTEEEEDDDDDDDEDEE